MATSRYLRANEFNLCFVLIIDPMKKPREHLHLFVVGFSALRLHAWRTRIADQLPACQMIFDVTGDLFTHGRQLKQFVLDDRIIGLLGKFPILGRFVP